MAFLDGRVLDYGLMVLSGEADRLDICSQEPRSFLEATSLYSRGSKAGLQVSVPMNDGAGGRAVTVQGFADGAVSATGTVMAWAISDSASRRLLASGPLSGSIQVIAGNLFQLPDFVCGIPGAA